jgi:hypothetical protein
MVVLLGAAACASPLLGPSGPAGVAWSAFPPVAVVPAAPSSGPLFGQPLAQQARVPGADPFAAVKVDYVSPSALETIAMCERKWAFAKLDRMPKVESKGALLGTLVHGQHEDWLKRGVPYDLTKQEGEIAQATLHLLPPPGVANVEGEMTFTYGGITYGGKLDGEWLEQPGPRIASHPPAGLEPIEHLWRAVVLDHKTGNKGFFKLGREQLLKHPQAPIYAARSFLKWQTPIVELRWNYATTDKKPKPFPSWHVVRPEDVHAVWAEQVERPAKRLLEIVDQANSERRAGRPFGAMQLPPNYNACAAFGGCPFRSKCALTGQQEIQAHMTQVNIAQQQADFLATLGIAPGMQAAAPAAPLPAPPTYTPPAAPATPAPESVVHGQPPFGAPSSNPEWLCNGEGGFFAARDLPAMAQAGHPKALAFLASLSPQAAAPQVVTSPIPQVAQASAFPAASPMTQTAAALPPQMAQGYGGQINPPESQLPPAVVAQQQAAAAPAPAPEKPTKAKAARGGTSDVYLAAIQGFCANPNMGGLPASKLHELAKAIAELAA